MTIVDLKGRKLDLISKCCNADLDVKNNKVHIYFCENCGNECGVCVRPDDIGEKKRE